MKIYESNLPSLVVRRKRVKDEVLSVIAEFVATDYMCVKVVDDKQIFNNKNDMCKSLNNYLKGSNINAIAKMRFGEVYLVRTER